MPRFVALLRGVNVGKGNRLPMAEFKRLLEGIGYTEVKTLLNSGNAVFSSTVRSSSKHARGIAAAVDEQFGIVTPVIVKSAGEFAAAINGAAIVPPKADRSRFLVVFGPDAAALRALSDLLPLARAPERFIITAHAAYLHCPQGLLESKVGQAMLGKASKGVTTRNWATVLKLGALLGAV